MKPKILRPGDTIALIAPASTPQLKAKITKSVAYFEKLGCRVVLGKNIEKQNGYLAGTDAQRLADLHTVIKNKQVKAIFMLRGGYGTIRLLNDLDYDLIAKNPKIFIGYSDATTLFNAIYKKTGLQSCFYGPMPGVDIWNGFDPFAEECLWRMISSDKPFGELPTDKGEIRQLYGKKSEVIGRVIGGNLTVFSSLMGTPYLPSLRDKILFFEDVNEHPYRIDRYLAQLKASGALSQAKAILLGQFSDCEDKPPTLTIDQVFKDYLSKLGVPVLSNLPFGHIPRQWTVPLGAKMKIENGKISIIESVLSK